MVKVRAWADPGRPGNSILIVETLYRPLADPSLPERELEHQVPREHPTALKVERILEAMLKQYGGRLLYTSAADDDSPRAQGGG